MLAACVALTAALGSLTLRGLSIVATIALAWAPLHLLLLASGSLASPALPLIAVWLVALLLQEPRAIRAAAPLAFLLPLATGWYAQGPPGLGDSLRLLLIVLLGAAVPILLKRTTAAGSEPLDRRDAEPSDQESPSTAEEAELSLTPLLELARQATGAAEAVLWLSDAPGERLLPWARAAAAEHEPPLLLLELEGHPYAWALQESLPVQLEPGKKPLPRAWATEMLLVPLEGGAELLALAFDAPTRADANAAALTAGTVVSDLRRLQRSHGSLVRENADLHGLAATVRSLHHELQPDRFAAILCDSAVDLTGAEGAAIALWDAEAGSGAFSAMVGTAPALPEKTPFDEGASLAAVACKHGTPLAFADVQREHRLPLCAPGERWRAPPRAVLIQPIGNHGRILGAVLAWHEAPQRFIAHDQENLRLLCSVAAAPLESALRYQALDRRAAADALTGLANRSSFDARFAAVCAHFQRYARPFAVVALDIDHFKRFNDTWGHEAGDRVLQHVAGLVAAAVREVDLPARLGGEEFVILLPETGLDQALAVAERVRTAIECTPLNWNGRELRVTASFGVAACPETVALPTETLASADAALYASKHAGRNRVSSAASGA